MYDYAFVHLKFTVPVAVLLTAIAYPILNRIHLIQTGFLVVVAFTAALPWDAYLIKHKVWSDPPEAIVGPRLLGIPFEELFFFVIQTYITALVYILFNKPVLHALHLNNQQNPPAWMRVVKVTGQVVLVALSVWGWNAAQVHQETSYLGLILVWACPFLLAIWTLAGRFILSLPWYATLLPMFLPTFYLWAVDEFALHRGTWSIGSGTKLDFCLFGKLDIEEATFFLVTNMLIVGGMAAFDQYLAVIYAFPTLFPKVNRYPTPHMLLQSRLINTSRYDLERIEGLREAVERLRLKSRSFYLANSLFSGRLRIDLILLYSFCRLADDLVDDAKSRREVLSWTAKLNHFLDLHYKDADATEDPKKKAERIDAYIKTAFPPCAYQALHLLPTHILPPKPLYDLIKGFEMDSQFTFHGTSDSTDLQYPIADDKDLENYAIYVAGTVGELCIALIIYHCLPDMSDTQKRELETAACRMGIALQYVNIARDIVVDARIGRVYLPTTWLKKEGLTHKMVLENPEGPEVIERMRRRLLENAFELYGGARPEMQRIPSEARGPMIGAEENYMAIGRVLRERKEGTVFVRMEGRATVPKRRRLSTLLRALYEQ
uniref:Bifunctional lycopene cyclase/phytoene synthase n=1 Tax=Neurospora crassa TaxID=5141 RepID=E7BAS1_NEUCS|nr:mutant phytoene synthase/carotene cyclase [Neurospora crassa]